jgi:hypothetical protein
MLTRPRHQQTGFLSDPVFGKFADAGAEKEQHWRLQQRWGRF